MELLKSILDYKVVPDYCATRETIYIWSNLNIFYSKNGTSFQVTRYNDFEFFEKCCDTRKILKLLKHALESTVSMLLISKRKTKWRFQSGITKKTTTQEQYPQKYANFAVLTTVRNNDNEIITLMDMEVIVLNCKLNN